MSIRKRGWKTAKGEAKEAWVVDYVDQAGKRRLKTFARKKDADAFRSQAHVEVKAGVHTPDSASITVAKAAEKWLDTCRARGLERSTINSYIQHARLHIEPFLGRVRLSQISAPGVREFEDKLRQDGRSPAMVRKILTSLGSLLSDAQERGLVSRNVVRELGSRRKTGTDRRADRRQKGRIKVGVDVPSREEIRAIVAAAQGRWRPVLLTAIFTGLRASELRGLRWADVDLKKSELHVRQRADKYNVIGRPKSESGERTVPLPPIVANALREWRLVCPKSDMDIVFVSRRGRTREFRPRAIRSCSGPDRGRRHDVRRQSEVYRPAFAPALLCLLVHQPARGWRPRADAKAGSGTVGAFDDRHDPRRVRASFPAWR